MKITNTQRVYCIEITPKQMAKILRHDNAARERANRTYGGRLTQATPVGILWKRKLDCLLNVFGVSEIEYDAMFGDLVVLASENPFFGHEDRPCVWVTIDEPNFEETLAEVQKIVDNWLGIV